MNTSVSDVEVDVLGSFAERLAELSHFESGKFPDGRSAAKLSRFEAVDITFQSLDGWVPCLLEVLPWLCLDEPPKEAETARAVLYAILEQIDCAAPVLEQVAAEGVLPEDGFARLEARVDRAVMLKQVFEEALEDGTSHRNAHMGWAAAWDENEDQGIDNLTVTAETKTDYCEYFISLAESKVLDLNPTYQRDTVWDKGRSQKLIESILRGIPLPSVIMNRVERTVQIVDGKQRLTALLRFVGAHPRTKEHFEDLVGRYRPEKELRTRPSGWPVDASSTDQVAFVEDLFKTNYPLLKKLCGITGAEESSWFFPFPLGKFNDVLQPLSKKYYSEIRREFILEELIGTHQRNETPHLRWEDIFSTSRTQVKYRIPMIEYQDTGLKQIHRIFTIYNQQGVKLTREEIRNATYHHLELPRLLLCLSGDNKDVEALRLEVYLGDKGQKLEDVWEYFNTDDPDATPVLRSRRYRGTKVISWLGALVLHRSVKLKKGAEVGPAQKSTSKIIDAWFDEVNDAASGTSVTNNSRGLRRFTNDVLSALAIHKKLHYASVWRPSFRSTNTTRGNPSWQDIPLVASLICCLLVVLKGHEDGSELVNKFRTFVGETKTLKDQQTKTQWAWLSECAVRFASTVLDTTLAEFHNTLADRYGIEGGGGLWTLAAVHEATE